MSPSEAVGQSLLGCIAVIAILFFVASLALIALVAWLFH